MDLLNTIKDVVVPDAKSIPRTEHATADHAVSDVSGAFPDADDAELGRQLQQKDQEAVSKRNHKHQDSGVDLLGNSNETSTGTAAPKLASSIGGVPGDYTPQPDIGTWNRTGNVTGQGLTEEASPSHLASRDVPDRTGTTPDVGKGYSGDSMGNVEEVSVQHLGNEGKNVVGGSGNQSGLQSASKGQDDLSAPFGQMERNTASTEASAAATRDPVVEYARQQTGSDNIGSAAQSGGNTGSGVLQEAAGLSEPTPSHQRNTQSEANLRDPVLDAARQQQQTTTGNGDIAAASQSGGNTDSSVLQEAAAGTGTGVSEGTPLRQRQRNTQSGPAAGFSGGIHNGVFGTGSDDVQGEGIESHHERSSQYRKGDVSSSITGVSESGLGQGGVHNGVVGLGSSEEETLRRSLDGQGQRDEF